MAYIGSRKHAQFINDWYHGPDGGNEETPPAGWSRLGEGSFRIAYLHEATDVVYKVEIWPEDNEQYGSIGEVRKAQSLYRKSINGRLGKWLRIPRTSGFRFGAYVVVAMEAVTGVMNEMYGTHGCLEARKELLALGFEDMHAHNYIVDNDGYIVPIDMASPMNSKGWGDIRSLFGYPQAVEDENVRRRAEAGW